MTKHKSPRGPVAQTVPRRARAGQTSALRLFLIPASVSLPFSQSHLSFPLDGPSGTALPCNFQVDQSTLFLCNPNDDQWTFGHKTTYSFNYVFNEEDSQQDVYTSAALPLVDAAVNGNHAAMIAYGQTGGGVLSDVL